MSLTYKDRTPGTPTVLDVLNTLYLTSSPVLDKVKVLSLELRKPKQLEYQKVYAAFQHLYQEKGMLGFFHNSTGIKQDTTYHLGLRNNVSIV